MTEATRTSKALSYWLRHAPEDGELNLDSAGWADTQAVLAALARSDLPATSADLVRIVSGSEKNRFELSPSGDRVRARQGHSIPVVGDWLPAAPPEHLYHGTIDRFLPSIFEQGLLPRSRHHVHLSLDVETASKVGSRRGKPIVLEVSAAHLAASGVQFLLSGNGVWLTDHVPPSALRVIDDPAG